MHADIHLQLHTLTAAELRHEAAAARPRPAGTATPMRVQLGWRLVEFGLKLAVTPPRTTATA
ncbi:hypothetical protein ACFYUJ_35465 [Streptomyces sp. NPDC004520]|uniref:hypothetical protein n=1 Tax=Streptomyces sp. NPDC004520 TaxID=3364702 RepID=UPI0036AD8F74